MIDQKQADDNYQRLKPREQKLNHFGDIDDDRQSDDRQPQVKQPIKLFLDKLKNVHSCGTQHSARCPAHPDWANSLSIGEAADGTVLIKCHAECTSEEIVQSLGLELYHLYPLRARRARKVKSTGPRMVPIHGRTGGRTDV